MDSKFVNSKIVWLILGTLIALSINSSVDAQGIYIPVAGPINRSMAGASTAAPTDAIGALYWNPATITSLQSEIGFGMDLLLADEELSSSIVGLGADSTRGEPGVSALPNVAWVQKSKNPNITYGLSLNAVAGFVTNYSASLTNPILTPQSNAPGFPGGFGRVSSKAEFLQMAPSIALQLTDRLSVGFGPTLTMGTVFADPFAFAAPDDADGSGAARYPSGRGTRTHFGGGAQFGFFYRGANCWNWGGSIKSEQLMETFRYKTENEVGLPRTVRFDVDLPMVISFGTSYTGIENVIWALDARYFDYENADGFADSGFNPDGSLRGLGWKNVFAVSTGVQLRMTESLIVRMGYGYNESPIDGSQATANIASPLIQQHLLSIGSTMFIRGNVMMNMAYSYIPEASVSGPIVIPGATIPGSSVTNTISAHILSMGVTVRY